MIVSVIVLVLGLACIIASAVYGVGRVSLDSDCKSLTMMKDSIKRKCCLVSIDTVSLQGLTKTAGDNHYHTL